MPKKKADSSPRMRQILAILVKHKIQKGITPVKLRLILEDLGPTYVKIGQIMSTRADIFSKRYTDELVKLREDVAPLDFEIIMQQLTTLYGENTLPFSCIDPKPLGSASIAQVHKAKLQDGRDVVIKIKRPGIYEQMEQDVKLMKKAIRVLDIADVGNGVVDFNMVLNEFWQTAQEEMDFEQEAKNAKKFKEQYKDCKFIDAPDIIGELSNKDILVMEYIEGYVINDADALDAAGYDREEIADKIAFNYISQIIENGYFHADPHSGNIRIRGDKIVWIDFGMMSTLSHRDKELMKDGISSIASQNAPMLVDTILTLGIVKREVDYTSLVSEMERFMKAYLSTDLNEIDIVKMVTEIFEICHRYAIMLPKGISMLARSLVTIEGTLVSLHPGLNVMELMAKHLPSLNQTNWKKEISSASLQVHDSLKSSVQIPSQTLQVLNMIEKGQVKLNLNLLGTNGTQANINRMVNRIIICVLDAALLLSSSVICTTEMKPQFLGIPLLGFVGYFVAMCLSIWLFFKMLFLHHKNKPF
jgi:ubiquinone biosynthesis protein